MKVIVHHPKDPKGILSLQKKVAVVHAEAVLRYIDKLHCYKEQKIDLLTSVMKKGLQ